jgi:hypothetical protein
LSPAIAEVKGGPATAWRGDRQCLRGGEKGKEEELESGDEGEDERERRPEVEEAGPITHSL